MNTFFKSFLFAVCFSFQAQAQFSTMQQNIIIKQLNVLCSDTWCESAYNFDFKKMTCDDQSKTCHLEFTTQDNSLDTNEIKNASCDIPNITSFDQLITVDKNIHTNALYYSLTDYFVEQVNACADSILK